jgi:hypothetical protein
MRTILATWMMVFTLVQHGYTQTDTLVMGSGYQNEIFYQLSNGLKTAMARNSWDIAFSIARRSATVRINDGKGIELYKTPYGPNDWANVDTTNLFTPSNQLFNSTIDWYEGAFNANRDPNNSFDEGWGMYNISTHIVTGTTIYVLKLPNNTYKKLFIELLDPNTGRNYYVFRYANLDNTNEVVDTIFRDNYANKEFVYYDLQNGTIRDLQPPSSNWDLLLTRYIENVSGTPYPVVGFLQHPKVTVLELYPVDTAMVSYPAPPYSDTINTIGYDWKAFDTGTFQYVIKDSLLYFVQDQANNIWKLVFLSFSGSSTGTTVLRKTYMGTASIESLLDVEELVLYPNPASDWIQIHGKFRSPTPYTITLYSLKGNALRTFQSENTQFQHHLDLHSLSNGYYLIEIRTPKGKLTRPIIVLHQ